MEKTIRVCDDCGVPLIWTFAFAYQERYCLNCGAMGGMLGTGKEVPVTKELLFQQRLVEAIWNVIYKSRKGLLPDSEFGRTDCKKDNGTCHNHQEHLTKAEKEWNAIARTYLIKFRGSIA